MCGGYIKIHRKIVDWRWYEDTNTMRLWIHLLLTANYEDKEWKNIIIKRGQRVFSRETLSVETGLTEQQIRTCLNHLKSTGEITTKSTSKYSVVTISKYETYQVREDGYQPTEQPTSQPSINQDIRNNNSPKEKDNINIIQKETGSLDLSIINERLLPDFQEYLKMRRQIRKPIKTQRALSDRYNELRRLSGGSISTARQIIQQSISHEWQSFVQLREEDKPAVHEPQQKAIRGFQ